MDYAKKRYGGPFTTSDVEDVKTFTRVFLMLLAVETIFVIMVRCTALFYLFAINMLSIDITEQIPMISNKNSNHKCIF